jgi:putative beta-lysine N-acetyltransferase
VNDIYIKERLMLTAVTNSNMLSNSKLSRVPKDARASKDAIENIGDSIIQHGKFNNRIYLMKLSRQDFPNIIEELDRIALRNGYSKIFAKVPTFAKDKFINNDYIIEARIPKFYNGNINTYFMGKYFTESRIFDNRIDEINKILDITALYENEKIEKNTEFNLPYGFEYVICNKSHIYRIADIYQKVFVTYPFPIHDPEYIAKTMDDNFIYFSIQKNDDIVAISSSEIDIDYQNVEMTDFATLPEYQGKGFALYLLYKMENEMRKRDIKTAYTIARAMSYGANIIFAKMGYKYGGTLYNNTNISTENVSGNFESMNVWYKYL